MNIFNVKQMHGVIEKCNEVGINASLRSENYGKEAANYLDKNILKGDKTIDVVSLLGPGLNAVDALLVTRNLKNLGYSVTAFTLFNQSEQCDELAHQISFSEKFDVSLKSISSVDELVGFFEQLSSRVMVIDGIIGTGITLPLSNFLYETINFVNEYSSFTVCCDVPTGVCADTGVVQGNAIKADLTLSNTVLKQGYYLCDAVHYTGMIEVVDCGMPRVLFEDSDKSLLKVQDLYDLLGTRDRFADKKVYGHTLVLGGSHGLTGSLVLAATASLKVGAGLVTAATWYPQYQEFISRLTPDIMTGYIPIELDKWPRLIKDLEKYSSIVIGPGLARSTRARKIVLEVLNNFSGPVVLDGDAINVMSLAEDENVFKLRNAPTVITPHFGELAKFCAIDEAKVQREPVSILKELRRKINCNILLKGPCTFLALADGDISFNYMPNDGLAKSGSGDVLAGFIGGLISQSGIIDKKLSLTKRYEQFNKAIKSSVLLHSLCASEAAKKYGVRSMTASSVIESLSDIFKSIDQGEL
ncbi:MAG: NAD(P)H-hydrate dehydratase [Bacteriovoracaceae bacterium]|jgi:NAD(P)H-hydrate epimerase|nr:NAD(P)H-hydrate dehydratase [Bacteriovoracaceae bacterium]